LLADLALAVAIALCAFIALILVADLFLIAAHLRRSGREPGARPLAGEAPSISVQLVVFNEAQVADAIDSMCALEWPRDRLEIMVLDDSTDESREVAARRVAHWRERGVDVRHLWRAHRTDYKAGALAEGVAQSRAQHFAIFDVDYRPAPDFLTRAMAALAAAPRAAFVQARLGYWNRDRNLLTRAQALQLDLYTAYEQMGRAWLGVPTPFNGTGAVWRRRAIEEAGGWRASSLLEDLDLSLRAFEKGWVGLHLATVSVAGELPDTAEVLVAQRTRWATGTGQSFRALPWTLVRHLRLDRAAVFVLLSLQHVGLTVAVPFALAAAFVCWLLDPDRGLVAFGLFVAAVALIVGLKSIGAAMASRVLGRGIGPRFLVDLVAMWLMQAWLVPVQCKSQLRGLALRGRLPFTRTAKKGQATDEHG
jgi:cellulose synthase/poly-beta-1,6-N-acetylglucosamine synthase-like glycosyltransferase